MDKQKVEITDEMLGDAVKCGSSILCSGCKLYGCGNEGRCTVNLAIALKAEREERKLNPGVWDGAPENAKVACVNYASALGSGWDLPSGALHTRTLPKSKARKIAEAKADKLMEPLNGLTVKELSDAIEAAILEYAKETK